MFVHPTEALPAAAAEADFGTHLFDFLLERLVEQGIDSKQSTVDSIVTRHLPEHKYQSAQNIVC